MNELLINFLPQMSVKFYNRKLELFKVISEEGVIQMFLI